ncbi:hypothetical protein HZ326_29331 [Fusarium oxysporum f. sp. albedinis]|nr:hypothetical protein HZ326_29331 [Fusarium oxysporum f. sp. albedinis]
MRVRFGCRVQPEEKAARICDTGVPTARDRNTKCNTYHAVPTYRCSIIESANDLARERVEEYNAKLAVFQAFCAKFEEADPPHRQGQPTAIALPGEDLRVFIRLEAGAPARAQSSYAIRTLIREKLGNVSNKIRQVFQVRSGWAVQTVDPETRDYLVEKQAEWAAELGATTVETNKEWFTFVISDFPRRLTDFYGNEVDSDSIISDEIELQTGLKPVDIRPS